MGWWQTVVVAFAVFSVAGAVDRLRQAVEKKEQSDNSRGWP